MLRYLSRLLLEAADLLGRDRKLQYAVTANGRFPPLLRRRRFRPKADGRIAVTDGRLAGWTNTTVTRLVCAIGTRLPSSTLVVHVHWYRGGVTRRGIGGS